MKRLFFMVLSIIGTATSSSQEIMESKVDTVVKERVSATIGADLVSQYIWRGQDLGNVSFQPTLGVGYKGFSLSVWGSVGISNWEDTKELDFTLDYSYKGLNIGITDYWFSTGSYFQYKNGKTTHVWEGFVGYDFNILSVLILMGNVPIPVTSSLLLHSSLLRWNGKPQLALSLGEQPSTAIGILLSRMSLYVPQRTLP